MGKKQKTEQLKETQLYTQETQQNTTNIEYKEPWQITLPYTKIEHITEQENMTTKPNTTKTTYTSYRYEGVYEWGINTSDRITQRHQTPDNHVDEEYEW